MFKFLKLPIVMFFVILFVNASREDCHAQTAYTLKASPTAITPGGLITASWSAPSNHSTTDWIGVFGTGVGNLGFTTWKYVPPGSSGTVNLTAPQQPGTYELRYLLNNGYSKVVTSEPITVSKSISRAFTFAAMAGGENPKPQTFTISNPAGGTLSWSVTENGSWLTVSPTSGTTTTETDVLTVSVDTAGLTANTYNATITVSRSGATTSEQIPVTLTVAQSAATLGKSPASLSFTGTQGGGNPASQVLNITNTGKGTLTWSASSNAAWLSLSATSGTTTTETDRIQVTVDASGLKTNMYVAAITLTDPAASNSPQTIPVTLALTAPVSGTATFSWDANSESDLAGYKLFMGTSSGSYKSSVDVGNVTNFKVMNLSPGQTYYFAMTAYNTTGKESGYSAEVKKAIP